MPHGRRGIFAERLGAMFFRLGHAGRHGYNVVHHCGWRPAAGQQRASATMRASWKTCAGSQRQRCASPRRCRIYRHANAQPRTQFQQFGWRRILKLYQRICRLAASQGGEVNGSKFWSASTNQQQLSPVLVAAASRDLHHDWHNRGCHAFTSLVNFSPPARSGER